MVFFPPLKNDRVIALHYRDNISVTVRLNTVR